MGLYPKMMLEKYGKIWETYGEKAESLVGFRDTPSTKPMVLPSYPFPERAPPGKLGRYLPQGEAPKR